MTKEQRIYSEEEGIVIFNVLKKILDRSFSTLNVRGIYAPEAGIKRNCLLIKYKESHFFLCNPHITMLDCKLSLYSSGKPIKTFSKRETIEVINYLYTAKYIDLFFHEFEVEQQESII